MDAADLYGSSVIILRHLYSELRTDFIHAFEGISIVYQQVNHHECL
jgi:hypothetical protein